MWQLAVEILSSEDSPRLLAKWGLMKGLFNNKFRGLWFTIGVPELPSPTGLVIK